MSDRKLAKLTRAIAVKMLEFIDAYRHEVERYDRLKDEWRITYEDASRLAPKSDCLMTLMGPAGKEMDAAEKKCRRLRDEISSVVLIAHGREKHLDPGESLALGVDDTLVVVTQHFEGGRQFVVSLLSIDNIKDISSKPPERPVATQPAKG